MRTTRTRKHGDVFTDNADGLANETSPKKHKTDSGSSKRQSPRSVSSKVSEKRKAGSAAKSSLSSSLDDRIEQEWRDGEIYQIIGPHREKIVKRLKFLCDVKEVTIDVGKEMVDAARLLKVMSSSTHMIESAKKQAQEAAKKLSEAKELRDHGMDLLHQSQTLFKRAVENVNLRD